MPVEKGSEIPIGGAVTKRCNKLIAIERTEVVRKRMFRGDATSRIVSELAQEWGLTERMVWNYVQKVYVELEEQAKVTRTPAKIAHRKEQLEYLYERALTDRDMRTALNAMNLICKIEGAFQPQEHRVTLETEEQKRNRLAQLLKNRQDYIDAQYEEVEQED